MKKFAWILVGVFAAAPAFAVEFKTITMNTFGLSFFTSNERGNPHVVSPMNEEVADQLEKFEKARYTCEAKGVFVYSTAPAYNLYALQNCKVEKSE